MRIFVVGAGQVGIDDRRGAPRRARRDRDRPRRGRAWPRSSHRFDVRRSRATERAGACSRRRASRRRPRHRVHVARRGRTSSRRSSRQRSAPEARTSSRTTDVEYLEVWRERAARRRLHGLVGARDGATPSRASSASPPRGRPTSSPTARCRSSSSTSSTGVRRREVVGRPLREARIPRRLEGRGIIRGDRTILPRGDAVDPGRRPRHRHRLAAGGARVERAPRRGRSASTTSSSSAAGESAWRSRACCSTQGSPRAPDRGRPERARAVAEELPGRARLQRDGHRPGVPRARAASLRRERGGLRDARRREEPLRGDPREAARRRGSRSRSSTTRARRRSSSARGDRRRRQPAARHRRGDRPLRPRPAHAAGRDARGRPLRGPRHHRAPGERARRPVASASCR